MRTTRLVLVTALFILLLNDPILSIADQPVLVLGVPLLFLYVLVVWALAIGATAWVVAATPHTDEPPLTQPD